MLSFQHIFLASTLILHSCAAFVSRTYSSPLHTRVEVSLCLSKHEKYSSIRDELSSRTFMKRDKFITALTFLLGVTPLVSNADGTEEGASESKESSTFLLAKERPLLKGRVILKAGEENSLPQDISSSALYITARPQRPDNVPKAVLDGSYGKPPPVLACRIPNPSFPCEIILSTADLTPEGAYFLDESRGKYWFEGENLIVSARWDTDGIASTRDPTDLVGRSQYNSVSSKQEGETLVTIELSGRGITGKLVTGKNTKS